jgi:butyryl-CoA dehydrogenase
MARLALAHSGDAFHQGKLATARFYYARLLPETAMLLAQVRNGPGALMEIAPEAI